MPTASNSAVHVPANSSQSLKLRLATHKVTFVKEGHTHIYHNLRIKCFVLFACNEQMQGAFIEDRCARWTTHHVVTAFKCVIHGPRGTPFQKYCLWKPKLLETQMGYVRAHWTSPGVQKLCTGLSVEICHADIRQQ